MEFVDFDVSTWTVIDVDLIVNDIRDRPYQKVVYIDDKLAICKTRSRRPTVALLNEVTSGTVRVTWYCTANWSSIPVGDLAF